MTAHKHAAMIETKAHNMDLVVFLNIGPEWVESSLHTMVANQDMDFFLCLPRHNESGQCLHWLNGGDVEFRRNGEEWQDECEEYHGWAKYCGMMNCDVEFRVKPRKEKRWIVAKPRALASMMYFESEEQAQSTVRYSTGEFKGGQVIEIEVEV
ncbi:hypothetical protein ValSw33_64 [Vibrio phage ValSw3-3]|nr:hypothetical protein ValSw33_64 [Vibrio phage ValSw3-3]